MSSPESTPPPASPQRAGSQAGSHLVVAALAVAAVFGWQAWAGRTTGREDAAAQREPADHGDSQAERGPGDAALLAEAVTASGSGEHDAGNRAGVEPELNTAGPAAASVVLSARAPVQITVTPSTLRVWHNTRLRLQARPGPDAHFSRFVWHFEDGSDPEEGATVVHVFPESVTDRHITLEAHRDGAAPLVISKRLPIERLAVVAVDGDGGLARPVPAPRGLRVALVGAGATVPAAALLKRLLKLRVAAMVVFGSAPAAGGVAQVLAKLDSPVPVLHVDTTLASVEVALPDRGAADRGGADRGGAGVGADFAPGQVPGRAPLTVVRDPLGRVTAVTGGGVWVMDHVALVVHDSRPPASSEAAMLGLQRALRVATAYPTIALLSARPLSPLVDGEVIADRAFRIYEHALRNQVRVAVSASSGVAYDGRYGGLGVVTVGQVRPLGCARLAGSDHCQAGTITLLDLPAPKARAGGRAGSTPRSPRVLHLRLPSLSAWLDAAVLPPAVGKYRR